MAARAGVGCLNPGPLPPCCAPRTLPLCAAPGGPTSGGGRDVQSSPARRVCPATADHMPVALSHCWQVLQSRQHQSCQTGERMLLSFEHSCWHCRGGWCSGALTGGIFRSAPSPTPCCRAAGRRATSAAPNPRRRRRRRRRRRCDASPACLSYPHPPPPC